MSLIGYALRMAKQYYEPKTYDHALRVAGYVAENPMIPDDKMDNCVALGIMHDLLEDTKYGMCGDEVVDEHFNTCLDIITKSSDDNYIDYIKHIKENAYSFPEAYWVKIADIKDHLSQTETLTEYLKVKYLKALPYLL